MSREDSGSALEDLWAGEFGDAYVERNRAAAHGREGIDVDETAVRTAREALPGAEYFADQEEEVPYRGQEEALFRRDYSGIYQERHPDIELVEQGFLEASEESSWDDVTWWLFDRG